MTTQALTPVRRAEREQHIQDCGRLAEAAMDRYDETANPAYRREAQEWAALQAQAVNSRPSQYVRALEIKRGLV